MTWTLAITGKGGVGKTTFAALAVRWLIERGRGPVLAVDADPNTCLDALLGVAAECSVGGVREEARQIVQAQSQSGEQIGPTSAGGMGKSELLDLKIQQALVEAEGFDLIAMGRPEGPGCYCYANNVLRGVLARLAGNYPAVVIDNEAGLENLSRRTVQESDWLVFVTDPSARGLTTARRLYELACELGIKARRFGVIINRARESDGENGIDCLTRAAELFAGTPVEILGSLPEDDVIAARDAAGEPVFGLTETNPVVRAAGIILERLSGLGTG